MNDRFIMKNTFSRVIGAAIAAKMLVVAALVFAYSANFSKPNDTDRHLAKHSILSASTAMHELVCPTILLLGIFSTTGAKYSTRRAYIRETILQTEDPRICTLSELMKQTTENPNFDRKCQVAYTFVIGSGGEDRPTDHNDLKPLTLDNDPNGQIEDDCTYLNIRENMEDGKSPTWFKFGATAAKKYAIDYIAKTDDDSMIGTEALLNWINEDLPPTPFNKRIYGGSPRLSANKNHIYAAGEFYFMSADLADYVANILTAESRLSMMISWKHTEDLDMGTFVSSHPRPIKFLNLNERMFWIHPKKTEVEFRESYEKDSWRLPQRRSVMPWNSFCFWVLNGKGL